MKQIIHIKSRKSVGIVWINWNSYSKKKARTEKKGPLWIGNIMTIWGIELPYDPALLPPPLIWGPSSGRGLTLPFDNRAIPAAE